MSLSAADLVTDWIHQAYSALSQLNVSVTVLLAITGVLLLALFFAVREAITWFLKMDDVKRDLRKLQRSLFDIESEVRALHGLIEGSQKSEMKPGETHTPAMEPPRLPLAAGPAPAREPGFPITH